MFRPVTPWQGGPPITMSTSPAQHYDEVYVLDMWQNHFRHVNLAKLLVVCAAMKV